MEGLHKDEVYGEIEQTFGQVPTWVQSLPEAVLSGLWDQMSNFYLAETAIPNKYKELIGLAVSGATRCHYCQLFHAEVARLRGATDEEIAEAGMMGGFTMGVSTFLNALATDFEQFRSETLEIVSHLRSQAEQAAGEEEPGAAAEGQAPVEEQPAMAAEGAESEPSGGTTEAPEHEVRH